MARNIEKVDRVVDASRGREGRSCRDAFDGSPVDRDVEGSAELGRLVGGEEGVEGKKKER